MQIDNAKSFLQYYERIRQRTLQVAACIPPDKIEWTYQKGKFTIGDLLRHIAAIERYMFAENFRGKASSYPGHDQTLASGLDAVLSYMNKMHTETADIIAKLTDSELQGKCVTPGGGKLSVWKWMRSMVEHEIHHRAQIYLYLSMLGIQTPPLYGLTEEQVFERSQSH